ncbi:MAG TPA: SDR family NAD(P)-dependent oxidoreductase, partial [Actinomycetospora sp.]|nr:SDR family NAD(P)-dependent oxidoreductase [Actinomycetospora sp.]
MATDLAGSLKNKVLFITGAARGIGEETARRAAAHGAHVAAVGMEPERLEKLVAELGQQGGRHTWAECDVTDQDSLEAAVATTVRELGGI